MTTSNIDLEQLGRLLKIRVIVLLQEELINHTPDMKNGKYIINLTQDVLANGGTHWIAVQFKNGTCSHYDSFGAPISTKILQFIKKGKPKKTGYSQFIKQALESELCGFYCLAFLTFNSRSTKSDLLESSNDFINMFDNQPDFNAGRLRQLFNLWIDKSIFPPHLYSKLWEKIKYA